MKKNRQIFVISLIVFYILLFEFRIFEISYISYLINLLKIAIPITLFMVPTGKLVLIGNIRKYIYFYIAFCFVTLISTLFSDYIYETFIQYLKIIPSRIIFVLALVKILYSYPHLIFKINKVLFSIAIITLLQYVLLHIAEQIINLPVFTLPGIAKNGIFLVGQFGIFGFKGSSYFLSSFSLTRLVGYWHEPSNASGFLFSAFFLGLYIKKTLSKKKYLVYFPLIAGVMTLSNAGYLALLVGGLIYLSSLTKQKYLTIFLALFFSVFILITLFGRTIVANYFPENEYLKAATGVRKVNSKKNIDYSGGRIDKYSNSLQYAIEHPFGSGFRVTGKRKDGVGDKNASASAIFFILKSSGFIGIYLMIMMKIIVITPVIRFNFRRTQLTYPAYLYLGAAFAVVVTQNTIYGFWNSPYYFYLSIATLIAYSKTLNINRSPSYYKYLITSNLIAK
jgi:hypothetical protein